MLINELHKYAIHFVYSGALENVKRVTQNFYSSNEIPPLKRDSGRTPAVISSESTLNENPLIRAQ